MLCSSSIMGGHVICRRISDKRYLLAERCKDGFIYMPQNAGVRFHILH